MGNSTDPGNTIKPGEGFLKLTRNGSTLTVASWFTPYNWQDLENGDIDLGSARNIVLNWPANFSTGFTLHSSANLPTGIWANNYTRIPTNDLFQAAVPSSATPTFYRLHR